MAVQTFKNYDATNGNAAKIYVALVSGVKILTPQNVDVTAQLKAADILVGGEEPSAGGAIEETFGSDWADVARYALGIKTNPDEEL